MMMTTTAAHSVGNTKSPPILKCASNYWALQNRYVYSIMADERARG